MPAGAADPKKPAADRAGSSTSFALPDRPQAAGDATSFALPERASIQQKAIGEEVGDATSFALPDPGSTATSDCRPAASQQASLLTTCKAHEGCAMFLGSLDACRNVLSFVNRLSQQVSSSASKNIDASTVFEAAIPPARRDVDSFPTAQEIKRQLALMQRELSNAPVKAKFPNGESFVFYGEVDRNGNAAGFGISFAKSGRMQKGVHRANGLALGPAEVMQQRSSNHMFLVYDEKTDPAGPLAISYSDGSTFEGFSKDWVRTGTTFYANGGTRSGVFRTDGGFDGRAQQSNGAFFVGEIAKDGTLHGEGFNSSGAFAEAFGNDTKQVLPRVLQHLGPAGCIGVLKTSATGHIENTCGYEVNVIFCIAKPDASSDEACAGNGRWKSGGQVYRMKGGERMAVELSGRKIHYFACRYPIVPSDVRYAINRGIYAACGGEPVKLGQVRTLPEDR